MAKQTVNIGTNANDGSGDPLRTAFDKLNDNFDEVYAETDWSEFKSLPAFKAGNRINAYQVYLSMEAELLKQE